MDENKEMTPINDDKRYPLWEIAENRVEIRKISQKCQDVASEYNSEMVKVADWTAYPRVAIDYLIELLGEVDKRMREKKSNVELKVGNLMTIGIEYLETTGADKGGSLNPVITVGTELDYEHRDIPYDDAIPSDMKRVMIEEGAQFLLPEYFDDRTTFKTVSDLVMPKLKDKYGIVMFDWSLPIYIFTIFFRVAKEFLIEHKDDGEFGLEINLADSAYFGIEKYGEIDNPSYKIYMNPGQIFKKENAKNDGETEKEI